MEIANNFPVFEADQVLSNNHLNDLFKYLDQQNRLTRCKLIGSGIVCGLEISYSREGIQVSKGSALTSQGFMALHCENTYSRYTTYTPREFPAELHFFSQCKNTETAPIPFYKPGFDNELFELVSNSAYNKLNDTDKEKSRTLDTVELDDYAIVLYLEAEQVNLKNCDTNDCNDKGSRMDFDVKLLLVKKSTLDELLKLQHISPGLENEPDKHIRLKRYNVPAKNLNSASDVLKEFGNLVGDPLLQKMESIFSNCYKTNKFLLKDELQDPFEGKLFADLRKLRDRIVTSKPILIQYFHDLVDDLIKAYYEFTQNLSDITSECCGEEMRFPLHVMLGQANVNTNAQHSDKYRQYFIYSSLYDAQGEKINTIRLLFKKMKLLPSLFSIDNMDGFEKKPVKVTPSRQSSPLSKKCIPYYYKVAEPGNELFRCWDHSKSAKRNTTACLSYNASLYSNADHVLNPLLYDLEDYNFFRIEGHIGKSVNEALSRVKQLQQQYNLPFETIALSADYIGAIVKGEEPLCVIQDLESDYRVLIAEFVCRIHESLCLVSKIKYTGRKTIFPSAVTAPVGNIRLAAMMRIIGSQPAAPVQPVTGSAVSAAISSGAAAAISGVTTSAIADDDEDEDKLVISAINRFPDALDHIFTSSLINEFHASKKYQKGDTLSRLCNPAAGLIGHKYISIIKSNNGEFANPVAINAFGPISRLTHNAFQFIDKAESVFKILMSTELAEMNVAEFKRAFKIFEKEVNDLKITSPRIAAEVEMAFDSCIVERLEALKNEYLRRTAQYRLAKNFNHYFKKHGGVEHKAGVPQGGTFILVYHEERKNRFVDIRSMFVNKDLSTLMMSHFHSLLKPAVEVNNLEFQSNLLKTATLYKDPDLFMRFRDVMKKYLDECNDLPVDRRTEITAIINKPPVETSFSIENETVIADFFVPYLCCSDCPPIAYILPEQKKDDTVKPALTIEPSNICSRSDAGIKLIVNRPGGKFIIDGVETQENISRSSDNLYLLSRSGSEWTPHEIAYKIGQDVSPAQSLTVTNTPDAKILPVPPGEARPGDRIELDAGQSTGINNDTVFEWLITGNSTPVETNKKKFAYTVQPNDERLTVQVKVSNGACPSLSKEFVIRITRTTEMLRLAVCSDLTKINLKTKFPDGTVIVDGSGIINEDLVVKPKSLNLSETKSFTVSYKTGETTAQAEIAIVVANADFMMQIQPVAIPGSPRGNETRPALVLKPKGTSVTKSWKLKQGNKTIDEVTDGKPVDITAHGLTFSETIEITHVAMAPETSASCTDMKTFKLTKRIASIVMRTNEPFDNHLNG